MIVLLLSLSLAAPAVDVDGRGLAADPRERRITGHVIERMLEAGIAVDPGADVHVTLATTTDGYAVGLRVEDGSVAIEPVPIAQGARQAAVVELEVVQVAVDLAQAHARPRTRGAPAIHVASTPIARPHRAALLAEVARTSAAIVPDAADAARVVCLDVRGSAVVVAAAETTSDCITSLDEAGVYDSVEVALAGVELGATPAVEQEPDRPPDREPDREPEPEATRSAAIPAQPQRRRPPWSVGARVGIGFAWRPRAFDAAPALGVEAASMRGLALGFEATWLPTRAGEVRSVDTLLAAGVGYRATFGRVHLSVVPAGGASIHAARVGAERVVRVDALVLLPIQVEGRVHRHAALGARLSAASTFRSRVHAIHGFEVWRRGAVMVMLAATARFGS